MAKQVDAQHNDIRQNDTRLRVMLQKFVAPLIKVLPETHLALQLKNAKSQVLFLIKYF
jgi:hypothetical protein